jgi:ABC-type Mn2+/Zn2+ transport system ATPase subunit
VKYKSFRIRNFKGIKDTTVAFSSVAGASVYTLVGLNESGKTTILEAIHSFSPDKATSELVGGDEGSGIPYPDRVPRHLISTFTGNVSVIATLSIGADERQVIFDEIAETTKLVIDQTAISNEISFARNQRFTNGDFQAATFSIVNPPKVRNRRQRSYRDMTEEEHRAVRDLLHARAPTIAYFPTFVFDFPERIFLTDRGGAVDRFYRRVFQDILDYDGHGHVIDRDIIRRVRSDQLKVPWIQFFTMWTKDDDREKIQHVMDRASAAVTKLVFGRWNLIFHEETRGKELVISYDVLEGERTDPRGIVTKTNEHDVFVTFQIRDGTRRFKVNDRSLGFRWFFAFLLFTQFRASRKDSKPILFLFDEPASNLHSAAQQKLLESFPEIAKDNHTLLYTTHSHYMIEPKWLEQTFIVTNRADTPSTSVLDAVSLDDESLDIRANTYRSFVNSHPTQTSYFQPILDRLQVVPSRFDLRRASVIIEGKSDYYLIRYAAEALGLADLPLLPALGAGTFGALAALHVGWNLNFVFVLDGDKQGKHEKTRYTKEFGIPSSRIATIDELCPPLKEIEGLLDQQALIFVQGEMHLKGLPNKGEILRFVQERLASHRVEMLSLGFKSNAAKIIDQIQERLAAQI